MQLAKMKNVKKYYNDRLILNIDNFEIFEGDRIGLVGINGAGKSTLIKTLIGAETIEEGEIYLSRSFSYISQIENISSNTVNNKISSQLNSPNEYKDYLSGGEKVKIKISAALSENRALIIADEPTSNLDRNSISVLTEMLSKYKGSLLLISHDRSFLDMLCNKIVEIDKGKLSCYAGNYSKYLELKRNEKNRQECEYNSYINEKNRLERAIITKGDLRDSVRKAPKRMGNSEARLHKMGDQRSKKNIENSMKAMKSRIEHLDVKVRPEKETEIKIRIQDDKILYSKIPIEIKDMDLFGGDKLLINNLNLKIRRGKKTALIGANGSGKTTLIKKILDNNSENISISKGVALGYFSQTLSILEEDKTILDNIKSTSSFPESFIRINLDGFGFKGDTVLKKISILSGGEKVKVSLCKILLSDNNLLILDEPTNYLDIKTLEKLEEVLKDTDKTLLIVSHDKRFIENLCDCVLEIENFKLREFNMTYKEYIEEKNKPIQSKSERKSTENLMLLELKLSEVISLLSVETDNSKKIELDNEYKLLIKKIQEIKNRL